MEVIYKGVNVSDDVSVNMCIHDMYAEHRADTLEIRFNDDENLWDSWNPKIGDEIEVEEESIKTGKMYVFKAMPENGLFTIKASSTPPTFGDLKSKAWQKVKLSQIGKEIAGNHGLTYKSYGVDDVEYKYILQENQSDASFLQERCTLEGCAFLVFNGKLVLYNEKHMESQTTEEIINVGIDDEYKYSPNSLKTYGKCIVQSGNYKGEYKVSNGSKKELVRSDIKAVTSNEAAKKYAKNMLRSQNKNGYMGFVKASVLTGYAAASMAKLKNERCPNWDGNVFITHIRNDYGNNESKIFFRRPLEGY